MKNKNIWLQKLTSRKLWTTIAGIMAGLAAAFGLPENDITQIAGVVASAVSVAAYIMGESRVDAAAAYGRSLSDMGKKAE